MPLISNPYLAPTPVPTIRAVGVANPRAHGQAITNVDTRTIIASSVELYCPYPSEKNIQASDARIAQTTTNGTNTAEILSTNF